MVPDEKNIPSGPDPFNIVLKLGLRGRVRDLQADFTIGVKHYVSFLRNFYVV